MAVELVPYRGWSNAVRLSNADVELVATLDVGPRVLLYQFRGSVNVFKNYDGMMGNTGEPDWQIRGGHRFWLAPEDLTRTYFPDNRPVQLTRDSDYAITLTPPPESEYGTQKTMQLAIEESGSRVRVLLTVTNVGQEPTTLAPWGPTVMAPGGVEIIPLPAKSPHPGSPANANSPADFAPNQTLILWPYFTFADPRWTFHDRTALLRQDSSRGPTKIGLAHREGWVAYANAGTLFVKRFDYREGAIYPDNGTRYQTFTNEDMLEMETCGELVTLAPGEATSLEESWELFADVPAIDTPDEAERIVWPIVTGRALS